MLTDWTETDPHYFFARGALYGFVLATFLWLAAIPWVRKKLRDRREARESTLRWEGRHAYWDLADHGIFEGSGTLGRAQLMCNKHNPYTRGSNEQKLWERGFLDSALPGRDEKP